MIIQCLDIFKIAIAIAITVKTEKGVCNREKDNKFQKRCRTKKRNPSVYTIKVNSQDLKIACGVASGIVKPIEAKEKRGKELDARHIQPLNCDSLFRMNGERMKQKIYRPRRYSPSTQACVFVIVIVVMRSWGESLAGIYLSLHYLYRNSCTIGLGDIS